MTRFGATALAAALVLMAAGLSTPATADWLVTTDGTRLETRGPWQVRDDIVVFTTTGGTLTSMRLADCNLAASTRLTAASKAPQKAKPKSPPQRARKVFVLTDADVGHSRPAAPKAAPEAPKAQPRPGQRPAAAPEKDPPSERVVVTRWRPKDADDGTAIRGQIANVSSEIAASIEVVAVFKDSEGEVLLVQPASLSATTLKPGQRSEFHVMATDLFSYSTVDFELDHFSLLTKEVRAADQDSPSR
jgi:hypothetical protein